MEKLDALEAALSHLRLALTAALAAVNHPNATMTLIADALSAITPAHQELAVAHYDALKDQPLRIATGESETREA
jgi:hypothetical protein